MQDESVSHSVNSRGGGVANYSVDQTIAQQVATCSNLSQCFYRNYQILVKEHCILYVD